MDDRYSTELLKRQKAKQVNPLGKSQHITASDKFRVLMRYQMDFMVYLSAAYIR